MNASELTFGIEIEATIPTGLFPVGPHGQGLPIAQLPGWKADRDPSIVVSEPGRVACEFVSPIYTGTSGLKKLIEDIKTIKGFGAATNASCGLHIHVGFDRTNAVATERLTTLVSNFEKAIFAATGTKNRERGRWCNSIRSHGNAQTAINRAGSYRYHILNLASHHPTVEFRPFAASLNADKITGYVCMCLALVERSLNAKRNTNWAPKETAATSPIHRNGDGQTQLCRFFYAMGWTQGRTPYVFGNAFGETKTIQKTKKALVKMAEKYDAQL